MSPSPLTPLLSFMEHAGTEIQDRVGSIRETLARGTYSGQQDIDESLDQLARWASALGSLRMLGSGVTTEVDVEPAVRQALQLLESERRSLGISFRTLGGGFRADVGSGVLFLALYTALRSTMAGIVNRPKGDREILINLQPLDREVRVSWVSSKQDGPWPLASGRDPLAGVREVLDSGGVRVDFRPQDACLTISLNQERIASSPRSA